MTTIKSKGFLILDFGASLKHTHHKRLLQAYCNLLDKRGQPYTVLIPLGSEIDSPGNPRNVFRCLLPSYHPVAMRFTRCSSWIPAVWRFALQIASRYGTRFPITLLFCKAIITWHALLLIFFFGRKYESFKVIFPTACPASLWITRSLVVSRRISRICLRLTNTAERHGPLSKYLSLKHDLSSLTETSESKVYVGFESLTYSLQFSLGALTGMLVPTPHIESEFFIR